MEYSIQRTLLIPFQSLLGICKKDLISSGTADANKKVATGPNSSLHISNFGTKTNDDGSLDCLSD